MIILKENEICPYVNICPYNEYNQCNGVNPNRTGIFTCDYVIDGKIISGQLDRLSEDKTGKMKVIME